MKKILGLCKNENVMILIYDNINKKDIKLIIGKMKNETSSISIEKETCGCEALNEYKKLKKHYIY